MQRRRRRRRWRWRRRWRARSVGRIKPAQRRAPAVGGGRAVRALVTGTPTAMHAGLAAPHRGAAVLGARCGRRRRARRTTRAWDGVLVEDERRRCRAARRSELRSSSRRRGDHHPALDGIALRSFGTPPYTQISRKPCPGGGRADGVRLHASRASARARAPARPTPPRRARVRRRARAGWRGSCPTPSRRRRRCRGPTRRWPAHGLDRRRLRERRARAEHVGAEARVGNAATGRSRRRCGPELDVVLLEEGRRRRADHRRRLAAGGRLLERDCRHARRVRRRRRQPRRPPRLDLGLLRRRGRGSAGIALAVVLAGEAQDVVGAEREHGSCSLLDQLLPSSSPCRRPQLLAPPAHAGDGCGQS